MRCLSLASKLFLILLTSAATTTTIAAQAAPAKLIVTVEPHHVSTAPVINREDVLVYHDHTRLRVTGWDPLQGPAAAIDFFILIDDSLDTSVASQFDSLRSFINAQPPTTAVGVAYMRNGTVDIRQRPTTDHAAAAKALRIPLGGTPESSVYESLVALVKQWPQSPAAGEALMITNGIEPFGSYSSSNQFVNEAIEAAQRASVPVFAIYTSGEGHLAHSFWRSNWAQTYLSQLAEETGGESYNFINQNVNFAPYFDDISQRLRRQYRLAFIPEPLKKPGIERVRVTTEVPNVELIAADGIWVDVTR